VIAAAVNEGIAGILNLRGTNLEAGLRGLIGDPALVKKLLDHELVRTELDKQPRGDATAGQLLWARFAPRSWRSVERASSYLAPEVFAIAFDDIYSGLSEADRKPATRAQVDALSEPGVDTPASWQKKLEDWFDDGMERVSGWYKRKTQIFVFVIAIGVTIGLNANAIRIAERLDSDPATRSAVVATAEKALTQEVEANKEKPEAESEIKEAEEKFTGAEGEVEALNLPLFWSAENEPANFSPEMVIGGWLLTIFAISLGAPFWFDALGKLANLRSAGKKPAESDASSPAGGGAASTN
jgi:hypothetical protein